MAFLWMGSNYDYVFFQTSHISFRRSLPDCAGRTGYPLALSAIGLYFYDILEDVLVDGGFMTAADMRYHFL